MMVLGRSLEVLRESSSSPLIWFLLLAVFLSATRPCQSADARVERSTIDESNLTFANYNNLTNERKRRIVTIEFNIPPNLSLAEKNRIRRVTRRKIIEYLNRRKKTTVSDSPSTITTTVPVTSESTSTVSDSPSTITTTVAATSEAATTVDDSPTTRMTTPDIETTSTASTTTPTTTSILTTIAVPVTSTVAFTTTGEPTAARKRRQAANEDDDYNGKDHSFTEIDPEIKESFFRILPFNNKYEPISNKRKRREEPDENEEYGEEDLQFIEIDPDVKNGILRIPLFIDKKGNSSDFSDILFEVANAVRNEKMLEQELNVSIHNIYKGIPPESDSLSLSAGIRFWLPILIAFLALLLLILFSLYCWKKNKKPTTEDGRRILEPTKVRPLEVHNGHGSQIPRHPPIILDDNSGWIIPYEHFSNS